MNKKAIYLTFGLIFFISFNTCFNLISPVKIEESSPINEITDTDRTILTAPKSSGGFGVDWWNNFSYIHINSNWSTAASSYDWCSGDGSWGNPYTLENMTIDALNASYCIKIEGGLGEYFTLRNITAINASSGINAGAILLQDDNGTVEYSNCSFNDCSGITLGGFQNFNITNNILNNNSNNGIRILEGGMGEINILSNTILWIDWDGISNEGKVTNIYHNNISYNAARGIAMTGSNHRVDVYNNTFIDNDMDGISAKCNNSRFEKNKLLGSDEDLTFESSFNINITNNEINGGIWYQNVNNNIIEGNQINGNTDGDGIHAQQNCFNSTIINNTIQSNSDDGIDISTGTNLTIYNNTLYNNTQKGVRQQVCLNLNISLNNITDNNGGISLYRSNNSIIINNNFTGNHNGIALSESNVSTIHNNTLINNLYDGIAVDACLDINVTGNYINNFTYKGIKFLGTNYSYIIDNEFINNQEEAIKLAGGANNNLIIGNTVFNNESTGRGLYTNDVWDSTIENNTMTYCGSGLWLYFAENITVFNNTITYSDNDGIRTEAYAISINITENTLEHNGEYGIYGAGLNNSFIIDNEINSNTIYGIRFMTSHYNNITDNSLCLNERGIQFEYTCTFNNITGNTINSNDKDGIRFGSSCNNNNILDNTINDNGDLAIWIEDSSDIEIAYNTMIGNRGSIELSGTCTNINEHDNTIENRPCDGCDGNGNGVTPPEDFTWIYVIIGICSVVGILVLVVVIKKSKSSERKVKAPKPEKKVKEKKTEEVKEIERDSMATQLYGSFRQKADNFISEASIANTEEQYENAIKAWEGAIRALKNAKGEAKKINANFIPGIETELSTMKSNIKTAKSQQKEKREREALLQIEQEKKAKEEKERLAKEKELSTIEKAILELGTKFPRLQVAEISEECGVYDEELIEKTIVDMISNNKIYAKYFSSTKSVAFDQQANIDDIDELMKSYKDWEEDGSGKRG